MPIYDKEPRTGRKTGTPNRKTVEMRALMATLVDDVDYQYRLRDDFRNRRIHPSIEALVWVHIIGKPKEQIEMAAEVSMTRVKRLSARRSRWRRASTGSRGHCDGRRRLMCPGSRRDRSGLAGCSWLTVKMFRISPDKL